MADHFLADALGHVRRTLAITAEPTDDGRLLERFVRDRDEAAFAELVARHGRAVWAACRRGTATAADAEDVFQATFFVFARRANRVRRAASVGGWLFRVAVRLSARTRARAARPVPVLPAPPAGPEPIDRAAWQELVAALDAELAGLPDALRAALLCCYYEGLTQDEAARRLGWKARTVRARVDRGRKLLRIRLARRGVEVGAALAAVAVDLDAPAGMPSMVLAPAFGRTVSPAVSALVAHGLAATGRTAWLPVVVAAAVVVVAGAGYAIVAGSSPTHGNGGQPVAVAALPPKDNPPPPVPAVDAEAVYQRAIDGCVYIVGAFQTGWVEGSGALIHRDNRLILTTCRVVGNDDMAYVVFPRHLEDGGIDIDRRNYFARAMSPQGIRGRVVYRDPARDLAVVQIDRLPAPARIFGLAETGAGERVLQIGSGTDHIFPMAVRTVEQVDAREATVPIAGTTQNIQAKVITLRGTTDDSGGPMVNKDGQLVGIVEGAAKEPMRPNVTLAVDVSEIRAVLKELNPPPPDPELPPLPTFPPVVQPVVPSDSSDTKLTGDSDDPAKLYKVVVDSTVFIVVPMKGGIAMGSGVLFDKEKRYVLTNYHVVSDADKVYVQFPMHQKDGSILTDRKKYFDGIPAGEAITGKVQYRDKTRDLAVVQLEKLPVTAREIVLARKSPAVGTSSYNIGSPGAVAQVFNFTQGSVRAVGIEDFPVRGEGEILRIKAKMVTATNPTSPDDSGGPLVNKNGELVAVAESAPSGVQQANRFIDVSEVRAFLAEKKIAIKELSPDPDEPKKLPRVGPGSFQPKDEPKPEPKQPAPVGADEKAAAQLLQRARLFEEGEDNRETYIRKLKDVIRQYPNTAAGKEAKKKLDALAN
jgi:RNA polymerase sigma factor (sigma-70 family)